MSSSHVSVKDIQRQITAVTHFSAHSSQVKRRITDLGYDDKVRKIRIGPREYWQVPNKVAKEVIQTFVDERMGTATPAPAPAPAPTEMTIPIAQLNDFELLHTRLARIEATFEHRVQALEAKLDRLLALWGEHE